MSRLPESPLLTQRLKQSVRRGQDRSWAPASLAVRLLWTYGSAWTVVLEQAAITLFLSPTAHNHVICDRASARNTR